MDIVQTLAEAILDVMMPQVYRYMKTYGTFSPTVLDLTEDRIHNYLGDSIEQALAECMQIEVQDIADTQVFSQLLRRHISKTVDSVLASTTQTPMLEFRNPVFYVSGCYTSISDLKNMAFELINILTRGRLSTDKPEIGQTEQRQSPVIRRIAASASSMCSSIRKKFSCFTRALRRPFSACVSPGEERRPTPTGGEETNTG
uniref:Uncharacterized protein n=1 Tax=Larimichthys crocea TaxID=215358 RepID=A0A0F8CFK0_LARCR